MISFCVKNTLIFLIFLSLTLNCKARLDDDVSVGKIIILNDIDNLASAKSVDDNAIRDYDGELSLVKNMLSLVTDAKGNKLDNHEQMYDAINEGKHKPALRYDDDDNESDGDEEISDDDDDDDDDDDTNLRYDDNVCKRRRRKCIRACKNAYRDACSYYGCRKSVRKQLRKHCKSQCWSWFF